jgi:propanediol dehydratase small subunit
VATPETFKITNCDLKESPRNAYQVPTVRFYRAWNLNAFKRAKVAARSSSKHSIMRTFVRLRQMLASNETLIERLDELEENYDAKFKIVFRAIRQLMNSRAIKRKPIGFRPRVAKK